MINKQGLIYEIFQFFKKIDPILRLTIAIRWCSDVLWRHKLRRQESFANTSGPQNNNGKNLVLVFLILVFTLYIRGGSMPYPRGTPGLGILWNTICGMHVNVVLLCLTFNTVPSVHNPTLWRSLERSDSTQRRFLALSRVSNGGRGRPAAWVGVRGHAVPTGAEFVFLVLLWPRSALEGSGPRVTSRFFFQGVWWQELLAVIHRVYLFTLSALIHASGSAHRVTVLTAAIIIQKSKSFSLYLPDLIKILITLLVTCKLFYPICQPFFPYVEQCEWRWK